MLTPKKLGQKIKEIRKKLGYSQDFIAGELGINRQAVISFESGKRKIDSFELFKIAKFFNVSVGELLEEKEPQPQKFQQAIIHLRNKEKISEQGKKSLDEFQRICGDFNIEKDKVEFGMFEKNKKKLESKKVNFKNLEGKDGMVADGEIDAKYFDNLPEGKIKFDDNFLANLSEEDFDRAFENIIKENLNGFAFKRSIDTFLQALFPWFKKYLGIDPRKNNGAIFVQNIVFNNSKIFGQVFNDATLKYKPVKNKEIEKKIKEIEEWNEKWEIAENRSYNPDVYKKYDYKLNFYNPCFLNFDSAIEKELVEYLEENKNKILWWWQNGNEHMALNFGIKYNTKSTFQPDFLVMFKDGRLGIYDTKGKGFQEEDTKQKAEALQKYIKEENKRRKKKFLTGGIIIKEKNKFFINSDAVYEKFGLTVAGAGQSGGKKKQSGWRFFEI
ncbi:helix-turn-helix transcriptional regulator [Candidatus Parcubacteria bacterium]|nr:helix-turn-helix transcriptional regulator [Candidatus Parcubacteria bacterium]